MSLVTVQRSPTPSTSSSPCVSESGSGEDNRHAQPRSISESFLTVKGAALFLPRGNGSSPSSDSSVSQRDKHTGDLQQHLQTMYTVLRPEDNIRLAVRLESAYPQSTRYMVVVSTNGREDTEESVVLGMDFTCSDSSCSVGLVLPLWSDTLIHLDGDGGFSVSTVNRVHVFKPVSVQAMWSALQSLHKACEVARCHNYYPGSMFLTWVSYYQSRLTSDQLCINEWNAMQDVQSHRADSPVLFTDVPTERERTERLIKTRLREIMMQKDLENVTSKEIRTELEMQMVCNLREFKEFIDNEMIVILGQMDSPTEIFDHVYLGSEWNASNLEELQNSGVRYILNMTREIDNFFPGVFEYHNIRVYDEEDTNLLEYWNDTYKFISKAKKAGAKCLVHCKMGVSRSASTVIAYAMKEYGWDLDTAFHHVKERRQVTKPNPSFMRQLEEYQGILLASKQRHNKLWRSHSESDLSERHEQLCKPAPHSPGRADPLNNNNNNDLPPSIHHFLGVAVLQALGADTAAPAEPSDAPADTHTSGSPIANGHGEPQEEAPHRKDPFLPPLPRPRAANLVPEEKSDSLSLRMVLTLPLPALHPPPALHIPQDPPRASGPLPEHKPRPSELYLDLPTPASSEEVSSESQTPGGGDSPSDPLGERREGAGPVPMSVSPAATPPSPAPYPSDDNNNPSQDGTGALPATAARGSSSRLSTDSIDFFSAREKFLGLSQDGATRCLSHQAAQRTPQGQEAQSSSSEDPGREEEEEEKISPQAEEDSDTGSQEKSSHHHHPHPPPPHDNGVSVRHIVTEIESISHPAPPPRSPPQPPLPDQGEEEEDRETGEVARGSPTSPSSSSSHPPPPPSTPPPADWPVGSVRRATRQLEQRLRRGPDPPELLPPRPPALCSPGAEQPPSSPCSPHPSPRPPSLLAGLTIPVHAPPSADCVAGMPPRHRAPSAGPGPPREGGATKSDSDGDGLSCSSSDMDTHPAPLCTRHAPAPRRPSRDAPVGELLWLEGVTSLDSDTDPPRGREPERIRESLRELRAFLYEAAGAAPPQAPRELPVWQRAMEIEARIRQAGLTTPSLMKRSASLAKLDRLELSANDLNDLELGSPPASCSFSSSSSCLPPEPPSATPSPGPDDAWKKQRVLAQSPPPQPHHTLTGLTDSIAGGSPPPPPPLSRPPPPSHHPPPTPPREEGEEGVIAATGRQQAKGPQLRRLRKKRTNTVLYNTM